MINSPPTKLRGSSYRLLFEFLIEADGYPMAEDLGEKIVEHLPLPGWVDEVKFVGVQVDE